MRILADENCDRPMITVLREAGFDVMSVREEAPGIDDEDVFALAAHEGRILLTQDQGFGQMAEREGQKPPAVVLLRLDALLPATRKVRALEALAARRESLIGTVTVIEPHQIRSRPFKS